jgi:hypothetical protein
MFIIALVRFAAAAAEGFGDGEARQTERKNNL